MKKLIKFYKDVLSAVIATVYLLTYLFLLSFGLVKAALFMLAASPLVMIWLVYTVIKVGKYYGPKLGNEEFGYADRKKETLGVI